MTHEEALNKLLAHSCANESEKGNGFKEYTIELHCAVFTVVAKPLGNLKYEIQSVERERPDNGDPQLSAELGVRHG